MGDLPFKEKVYLASWMISFKSPAQVAEKYREMFNKDCPAKSTLYFLRDLLLETGSVIKHRPRSGRPITASGDDKVEETRQMITNDPTLSIDGIADELGVSHGSAFNILHKKLHAHPYKPIYSQELHDGDDDRRLQFCQIMTDNLQNDPAYLRKITFSDECSFHLNGNVNKHNLHYWSIENPYVRIANKSCTTRSLTVWALVSCRGLVSYIIQEETMNAERYIDNVIVPHVIPYFTRHREMIFQQDGAACHYAVAVRNLLDQRLEGRWIGRRGPVEWPARSPDLTVCDTFLWSNLKDKVFTPGERFADLNDLRNKITQEIENIDHRHFTTAFRDWTRRLDRCIQANGLHFE